MNRYMLPLSRYIVQVVLLFFVGQQLTAAPFKVVIDAGHGGKDPGAVGNGAKEKNINLAVALRLGSLIKKAHSDVEIIYIRDNDRFVELHERARIANRAKANLYISIHTNWAKSASVWGVETFTLGLRRNGDNLEVAKRENSVILLEDNYQTRYQGFDPRSAESYIMFESMQNAYMNQSIRMASLVQDQMARRIGRFDRGVRQDVFLVLREVSMPSILVELGFITSRRDVNYLTSTTGVNQISQAIYNGFKTFKYEYDTKSGRTVVESNPETEEEAPYPIEEKNSAETPVKQGKIQIKQDSTATTKAKTSTSAPVSAKEETTPKSSSTITYRIQLHYGQKNRKFNHIQNIETYLYKGAYGYVVGNFPSSQAASRELRKYKKEFPQAFIIRWKNGKRLLD